MVGLQDCTKGKQVSPHTENGWEFEARMTKKQIQEG